MALSLVTLEPLDRGQLHVMRVHTAISSLAMIALACVGDWFAHDLLGFRLGTVALPVLALAIWSTFFATARRWRHWGYAFTGSEVHVAHGWLTRVHTIVPVGRVQHIDVTQGPVERMFGVAKLVLHTAGTDNSLVVLPGITRARAEEMRDAIRARITQAPW